MNDYCGYLFIDYIAAIFSLTIAPVVSLSRAGHVSSTSSRRCSSSRCREVACGRCTRARTRTHTHTHTHTHTLTLRARLSPSFSVLSPSSVSGFEQAQKTERGLTERDLICLIDCRVRHPPLCLGFRAGSCLGSRTCVMFSLSRTSVRLCLRA